MNCQVDGMIAFGGILPDVPVQSKGKPRQGPVQPTVFQRLLDRLRKGFPIKIVDVNDGAFGDIGKIVEMPRRIEGVAVN